MENLEGSKFNRFALQTSEDVESLGFSIYARWEGDEFVSALAQTGQLMHDRERSAWAMPIGIVGFTQFRYVIDTIASAAPSINAMVFQYCKPSGSGSCPGIGNYPSVGEGEISPAKCAEGFRGYAYRECHGGVLGEVKMDKVPDRLQYENNMVFVMGTKGSSGIPSYRNIITELGMQEDTSLPEGFTLNAETGEITGKPTKEMEVARLESSCHYSTVYHLLFEASPPSCMKPLRVLMIGSIALLSFCFSGWRCSSVMDRDGKVLLFSLQHPPP